VGDAADLKDWLTRGERRNGYDGRSPVLLGWEVQRRLGGSVGVHVQPVSRWIGQRRGRCLGVLDGVLRGYAQQRKRHHVRAMPCRPDIEARHSFLRGLSPRLLRERRPNDMCQVRGRVPVLGWPQDTVC
jgi:hypothetical protein